MTDAVHADGAPPFTRSERAALAVAVACGLAWHLWQMSIQSSAQGEYFAIERARGLLDVFGPAQLASEIHGPLYAVILVPWQALGDDLHTPLGLLWMRLPYLALSLAAMLLLASVGRRVGAPRAGVSAAALFAGLQLTTELAVTAQNYLPELTFGLWFTDRVAAFARGARGAAVLSLSAALALAAGYMNALVILPGLALVAATLVRERAWSTLRACAVYSLGFTLPILPRALGAAWHYASLSVGDGQVADPSLVHAAHHEALSLSGSFGRGEMVRAVVSLAYALFGSFAPALWLSVASARARPVAFAYAAAALGCFAAASTRVTLQLQNYGALLPFLLLATAVGVDDTLRVVTTATRLPPAARRATALAGLCLFTVGAIRAGQRTDALLDMPFLTLIDGDERPLRAALAAAPPALPVVMYHRAHWDIPMHALCRGTAGATATMNCVIELFGDANTVGGWHLVHPRGREVAHRPYRDGLSAQCTDAMASTFDRLAARPAWRNGWLVLRGELEPGPQPSCDALDARFEARCTVVARLTRGTVLRCPGEERP